ncbi:hypothetical protein D9M71_541100 [compost metagenome]
MNEAAILCVLGITVDFSMPSRHVCHSARAVVGAKRFRPRLKSAPASSKETISKALCRLTQLAIT